MSKGKFKRKKCKPLIIVVNTGKTDKMRNQTRTHNEQQNSEPEIRFCLLPETPRKQQKSENDALQNTYKEQNTSRIVKIYFRRHELNLFNCLVLPAADRLLLY